MMTNEKPGKVTAVMITRNMERHRYVMMSIHSFLHQTYIESQLLIVNDGIPLDIGHPRIHEIMLPFESERTLGDLRNIALDNINTPLVIQWDDDDWSHPERIKFQAAGYSPGKANLLKRQFRYDVNTGECLLFTKSRGIPGTIMHPASERRYPSQRRGEDTVFLRKWKKSDAVVVLDNDPDLYIRLYTGNNTWERDHIIKGVPLAVLPSFKLT